MKKYLFTILCAMIILTSCSSASDAGSPDSLREDRQEEVFASDFDEPEETESAEPASYVVMIDKNSLTDQITLIIDSREKWLVPKGYDPDIRSVSYTVTDLDHNGRLEILSIITHEDEYTDISIYETDKNNTSLIKGEWTMEGIDVTEDRYPDFVNGGYENYSCSELGDGKIHYQMLDFFTDPDLEYGIAYLDVTYSCGTANSYMHGAVKFYDNDSFVCNTEDGDEIYDYYTFMEYLRSHWNANAMEVQEFGLYTANYSSYECLREFMDADLYCMLRDSYYVFCGEMKANDYSKLYNTLDKFGERYENTEFYESIIGEWYYYSCEYMGYVEYYYESDYDMIMEFREDHTVRTRTEDNGEVTRDEVYDVSFEEDGHPIYYNYDDLPSYLSCEENIVKSVSEDGNTLTLLCALVDNDGYIISTTTFVLVRSR